MKPSKRIKIRWFFRSFFISSLIIFSCLTLFLGFCEGYARMESKITGKNIKIIKQENNRIYFLDKEISLPF